MKKIILPALVAVSALGLAACDGAETPAADDAAVAADAGADAEAAAADAEGTVAADVDADGNTVTISEDGVTADINDGDTSVSANIGDKPSATITTDTFHDPFANEEPEVAPHDEIDIVTHDDEGSRQAGQ